MDAGVHHAIVQIRRDMDELAVTAMRMPRREPYDHGLQVGVWQGLERALQILEKVDSDQEAMDSRL